MKIAVISDTHLHRVEPWLENVYNKYLASADILLHCGDFTSFSVWQTLCQHPQFIAVQGNCDDWKLSDELRTTESMMICGQRIGMVHGWGSHSGVAKRAVEYFGSDYDLICYGHTHVRNWDIVSGIRVINPGSLYNPRDNNPRGFAYLTISPDKPIKCEFVDI